MLSAVVTVPLPSTRVIHPRFEAHHVPVATGTMTAVVRVLRADTVGIRDTETGVTAYALPAVIYLGPARIQERDVGRVDIRSSAGRVQTRGDYLITLSRWCPAVLVRDVVEVFNDADPTDRVSYEVKDAERGSLRWETDLGCDLVQPTNAGGLS